MMILKPPVVPRPSIGGPPNVDTTASPTSSLQRSRSFSAMASALRSEPCRSSNGLSMTYIEPRLGALAFRIKERPEMPTVCSTPGVSRAIFSIWAITVSVRSTEAASGNCTLRIK